jgi:hypothetical protein
MQTTKTNKHKKKPCKWVALVHAHRRKNDKQSPRGRMIIEKQRNLNVIKRMGKN